MRWKTRDDTQWHTIFAYVPHSVGGLKKVWLEDVERKRVQAKWPDGTPMQVHPSGATWFYIYQCKIPAIDGVVAS